MSFFQGLINSSKLSKARFELTTYTPDITLTRTLIWIAGFLSCRTAFRAPVISLLDLYLQHTTQGSIALITPL